MEITRKIDLHETESASKKGTALGQVDIVIVADSDTKVDLRLTYSSSHNLLFQAIVTDFRYVFSVVSNVKWTPTYELHATTVNGKPSSSVSLHYRARVLQSTGEDWNNTTLTLSTIASDTVVKRIPELYPVKVRPKVLFQKASNAARNFKVNFSIY